MHGTIPQDATIYTFERCSQESVGILLDAFCEATGIENVYLNLENGALKAYTETPERVKEIRRAFTAFHAQLQHVVQNTQLI